MASQEICCRCTTMRNKAPHNQCELVKRGSEHHCPRVLRKLDRCFISTTGTVFKFNVKFFCVQDSMKRESLTNHKIL